MTANGGERVALMDINGFTADELRLIQRWLVTRHPELQAAMNRFPSVHSNPAGVKADTHDAFEAAMAWNYVERWRYEIEYTLDDLQDTDGRAEVERG